MTDVKVVAPINMGQGLKYNSTSKQYDVNTNTAKGTHITDNEVGITLSKDPNNKLELRANGLFYGDIPTRRTMFISSVSGDDNNDGSREHPMKTIAGAFSKSRSDQSVDYFLKAGEVHYLPTDKVLPVNGGSHKTLSPYNNESTATSDWETGKYKEYPTIAIDPSGKVGMFYITFGSAMTFRSCIIDLSCNSPITKVGAFANFLLANASAVGFSQVKFVFRNTPYAVPVKTYAYPSNIYFDGCYLEDNRNGSNTVPFYQCATGDVIRFDSITDVEPNTAPNMVLGRNMPTIFSKVKYVNNIVRVNGVPISINTNLATISSVQ